MTVHSLSLSTGWGTDRSVCAVYSTFLQKVHSLEKTPVFCPSISTYKSMVDPDDNILLAGGLVITIRMDDHETVMLSGNHHSTQQR